MALIPPGDPNEWGEEVREFLPDIVIEGFRIIYQFTKPAFDFIGSVVTFAGTLFDFVAWWLNLVLPNFPLFIIVGECVICYMSIHSEELTITKFIQLNISMAESIYNMMHVMYTMIVRVGQIVSNLVPLT